ncbi:alpha-N-acetylgalactosaminidase isoform X2 [Nilaparvata lugens]|uniref:Alpha-galactosidase n=1 Tax=Nilaparvata lugens TaxID=108931 RepID=A0A191UR38_NILLU|nr:alpha-N-acetylgalactosaminidase isoform X2 [Nilaparvata lugens]ANJ04640.1 alpha-N-acetylgalactosaminidase [Nilaparvata lugens]
MQHKDVLSQLQLSLAILVAIFGVSEGLDNGLALKPPMGWMSWERYRCNIDCETYPDECISENLFRRAADLLVSEGFKNVGYEYVIVDDCWLDKERDVNGDLQPDPKRFPSGIKSLADYIHSKGLKFGLYEDYGTKTCEGYPGVIGHMQQDAAKFAEWGVDYVKLDGCNADPKTYDHGYPEFGRYLRETNRPMVYSCSWPAYQEDEQRMPNYTAIAEHCNLWRNYGDIQDSYYSLVNIMDHFGDNQHIYIPSAGPGHWNDPDMLIIGNFALSYEQSKLQMAIWAILAAPLIMSNNLEYLAPDMKAVLQNRDVIAVNQDELGIQGRRLFRKQNIQIWSRPVMPMNQNYYSYAIAFVSRRSDGIPFPINCTLSDLGLYNPGGYMIRDLYNDQAKEYRVVGSDVIKVRVVPTGVAFLKATVIS